MRPDLRIPLLDILHRYLLAGGNLGAGVVTLHLVKAVAVSDHARLIRGWSGDAIPLGCRLCRRLVSDHIDADIIPRQQRTAGLADGRIPVVKFRQRNAVLCRDTGTRIARLNRVKLVAVADHTGLGGSRRGDAISWLGCCLGWCCRLRTRDVDTDVIAGQQVCAVCSLKYQRLDQKRLHVPSMMSAPTCLS